MVAFLGIIFGISRFVQLIGVEKMTGNDFGISGKAEDVAKVDNFIMIEGVCLLVLHVFLLIGTCSVSQLTP